MTAAPNLESLTKQQDKRQITESPDGLSFKVFIPAANSVLGYIGIAAAYFAGYSTDNPDVVNLSQDAIIWISGPTLMNLGMALYASLSHPNPVSATGYAVNET